MSKDQYIINEMAELLSNPVNIQNDMSEAYELMRNHIHKKYVERMVKVVEGCEKNITANPPVEVKLLKAMKPFAPAEAHDKIDNLINVMQRVNTLSELRSKLNSASPMHDIKIASESMNPSVHNDGVYDVDEACLYEERNTGRNFENMAGILMMMSML